MSEPRATLPAGTVTFLFTDIEGSTQLLRRLRGRYGELIADHAELIRAAVASAGGAEVDTQGDAFFCAFARARDAVAAAAELQRRIAAHAWPDGVALAVRAGIHTGEPDRAAHGYLGIDVHRAARICALARGGEVLLSELSATLARDQLPEGVALVDHGEAQLKDFPGRERLYRLAIEGLPGARTGTKPPAAEPFSGAHDALASHVAGRPLPAETGVEAPARLLVVSEQVERLQRLALFACTIAERGPDVILACLCADASTLPRLTVQLGELRRRLRLQGVLVRVAALHAADPGEAVEKLAELQEVDMIVADGGRALDPAERSLLARPLRAATCDVVIDFPAERAASGERLLVPFSGSTHDWAALELATLIAGQSGASIVLAGSEARAGGGDDASRVLAAASLAVQQLSGVVPEPMLVPAGPEGVLAAARDAARILSGVPPDFARRGLGTTRREIARRAGVPVTFVRRGEQQRSPVGGRRITRFSWTFTAGGSARDGGP